MSKYIPINHAKLQKENERLAQLLLDKQTEIEYLEDKIITLEGGSYQATPSGQLSPEAVERAAQAAMERSGRINDREREYLGDFTGLNAQLNESARRIAEQQLVYGEAQYNISVPPGYEAVRAIDRDSYEIRPIQNFRFETGAATNADSPVSWGSTTMESSDGIVWRRS